MVTVTNHGVRRPHPGRVRSLTTTMLLLSLAVMFVIQTWLLPSIFHSTERASLSQTSTESFWQQWMHDLTRSKSQLTTKERSASASLADAWFNGVPVTLQSHPTRSHVHCVGENYRFDAWKHRSCRFSHLCFNQTSKSFVVLASKSEVILSKYLARNKLMHASSTLMRYSDVNATPSVALGGMNQKWGEHGMARLEWFPEVRRQDDNLRYYALPDNVVLIPFHSLNGANPGHLVWDDFLPIFTLLSMFQLLDNPTNTILLPLRYVLHDGERALWASCDVRPEKKMVCDAMMRKFGPLLLGDSKDIQPILTSIDDFEFTVRSGLPQSDLVCAKTAVAGTGALTDHGLHKSHGWERADYETSHNDGRGGHLYLFRNFLLHNIGLPIQSVNHQRPRRIVFSQASSDILSRSEMFEKEIGLLRAQFPMERVQNYTFKAMSLHQQVKIASETAIFITLCGGGAVTAMFLPKGASVILFYREDAGVEQNIFLGTPARLDWDLFNSMSHLRVHWLPENTKGGQLDSTTLVLLIQHELDLISSQEFV